MQMKSGGLSVLLIAFSGNSNVNDVKVCSERVTGSRTYQAVRDLLDLRIARYPHLVLSEGLNSFNALASRFGISRGFALRRWARVRLGIHAPHRLDSNFLLSFFNSVQGRIVQAQYGPASRATCSINERRELAVLRLAGALPDGPPQLGDRSISGVAFPDAPIPRSELLEEPRGAVGKIWQFFKV
jgi:hypothetical protein